MESADQLLIREPEESKVVSRNHHGSHEVNFKGLCHNRYLVLASVLASAGGILFGYDLGIASGAILQLHDQFGLSCFQQEMVISIMLVGALVMSFFAGFVIDNFGRRVSIIASGLLYGIGAIIAAGTSRYEVLLFGRLVLGFATSLSSTSECVYVSEIAPTNQRGTLVAFNELGITLGFLFAYCSNAAFASNTVSGWRWMFGLSVTFAFIVMVTAILLPYSPRFLIAKGRIDEARKMLSTLRQLDETDTGFKLEWAAMKTHALSGAVAHGTCTFKTWNVNAAYSLVLGLSLVFIQQMTGQPNLLFYASTVLVSFGFKSAQVASLCAVGLGMAKLVSTILCMLLVDRFSRKAFLILGCFVMSVSLLAISVCVLHNEIGVIDTCSNLTLPVNHSYINLTKHHIDSTTMIKNVRWVVFLSLVTFVAGYAFSFGPITWIILGEIFPTTVRGKAFSLTTSLNWGINLIISSTFLDFSKASGSVGWPFLLNSLLGFVSLFFMYKFVPETKGKTLEEIQDDLRLRGNKVLCFFKT